MQNTRENVREREQVAVRPTPVTTPPKPVIKRQVKYPLFGARRAPVPASSFTAKMSQAPQIKKEYTKKKVNPLPQNPDAHKLAVRTRERVAQEEARNTRVQHELREMQETQDLREVDDDVEDIATLLDWSAQTHIHQEKSVRWYMALAGGTTVAVGALLFLGNIVGAFTVGFAGLLTYILSQHEAPVARYRIMVDGVAINTMLYHFRDLHSFNVIYNPGQAKTVILRSKHMFSPHIHLAIGDMDPVAIRDVLLEFLPEDQEMDEPFVDVIARRLGY